MVCRGGQRTVRPALRCFPVSQLLASNLIAEFQDLDWLCDFMQNHLDPDRPHHVRPQVRSLVHSLDVRGFATEAADFSLDDDERSITGAIRTLPSRLPRLRCLLLDGHADANLEALARDDDAAVANEPLLMLSVPKYEASIKMTTLSSPYFRGLVYLDISDVPKGVARPALWTSLTSQTLAQLRVLKIQGHEMGGVFASRLVRAFRKQLWSLDLSRNRISDDSLLKLADLIFPDDDGDLREYSRMDNTRFAVEGNLRTSDHSNVMFVDESDWSATFSHPDRYRVDAPGYPNQQPNNRAVHRLDGRTRVADDSAAAVKATLVTLHTPLEGTDSPFVHRVGHLDLCQVHDRITHFRLNGNLLTASGVAQLLRLSRGHLQNFECDSMHFRTPWDTRGLAFLPPRTELVGMLGAAHLFRPVFSSNLQVLRIHHSLVTQILTVETDHLPERVPTMVASWAAETYLLPRAEVVFPQTFVPDMNPRIRFLTLTKIPRRSTGPLIQKLVTFLRLASIQERAVRDAQPSSRHAPQTMSGLRYLGLEFEHDPIQELEEMDSSFDTSGWAAAKASASKVRPRDKPGPQTQQSVRLPDFQPVDRPTPRGRFVTVNLDSMDISVWAGPEDTAVSEYARLATIPEFQRAVQPATPNHVAAGVPPGSYIFGAAWDAMFEPKFMERPEKVDLERMRDVITAIKEYRAETRKAYRDVQRALGRLDVPLGAPHFHWTGEIKVFKEDSTAYYTNPSLWR